MSIAFFTDEDARGPILVHYHIFKNAGSTVEYALRREFHEFFSTFEGPHPNSILTYDQLVEFVKSNPLLRAVSSHHLRYPTLRDDLRPVIDICVLRHPLDRLFSVYRFLREKYSGKSDLLHQAASELGCAAFFRQCLEKYPAWMRNVQVGILGPGDPSSAPAALAELSRIALLATTDFFDESLVVWEYALFPVFQTNLIVENNIIHSNTDGCITLLEGVSHSSIQNNVCFNNGRAALIFWSYQSSDNTIRQYDQNYNTIRHNTFYINSRDLSADGVSSHPAILVDVQNPDSVPRDLGHNTYEANVFSVVTGAPVIQYRVLGHLQTDTYRNNVMYTNGPAPVNVAGSIHNWEWFLGLGALITGNVSTDPRFAAADPSWYKEPDRFDLRPRGDSPAVGRAGIGSLEAGSTRQTNPDAGAYEHVLEIKKN